MNQRSLRKKRKRERESSWSAFKERGWRVSERIWGSVDCLFTHYFFLKTPALYEKYVFSFCYNSTKYTDISTII